MPQQPDRVMIEVDGAHAVSGLCQIPERAFACHVMAHGAGAGMTHPFMAAVADGLGERRIATLRYNFPAMEQNAKRPDKPALAHATVRAAVAAAARVTTLPLIAGGKSFGARMTSQAQASTPLPGVRGLVFIGFPLHPPKIPSDKRAQHLAQVKIPMLFLQGTRDALADMHLLAALIERLGKPATLITAEGADHAFHVPRSGRTDAQVLGEMLDAMTVWAERIVDGRAIEPF